MSAQQLPQHAPVRLLIADTSENIAHELDSMLRDAGVPTRPKVIDDLDIAADILAAGEADLFLCNGGEDELTQVINQVRNNAPSLPVILLTDPANPVSTIRALELGATDVVPNDQPRHLLLVVRRELDNVCQRLRYTQMQKALEEAEQRCQLLLQSSKAAIAYVHEGMHIYANEAYVKMFGFAESDDLLGLPLIDLATPETTNELRQTIKDFGREAEERCEKFAGQSSDGSAIDGTITLAKSEYEGESCVQVTIRHNEPPPVTAPPITESSPETATEEAADTANVEESHAVEQSPNVASQEQPEPASHEEPDTIADGAEFAADDPDDTAAEAGNAIDEVDDTATVEESDITADQEAVTDEQPASEAFDAATDTNGSPLDLPSFLDAVDGNAEARYLFVVAIDAYEALQKHHGLKGALDVSNSVAKTLQLVASDHPFVRLDGSHFAFALAADSVDAAVEEANVMRANVEELLLEIEERTVRPTVSMSGCELDFDNPTNALLDSTFTHLATAQQDSANTVTFVSDDVDEVEDDETTALVKLINNAIDNHTFTLLFQPIISLRGDSDEHYEVFLRMLDTKDNQMRPAEFLQTAIDNNVAGKIDRWVILQSIKMLSAHRAKGHNTRLTINVTCNSVADTEFIQWLGVAIKAARLPSDAVIFQITEADAATYIRQTREFVEGLKSMHVRSSLSRFGTLEESFETLRHIPAEFVKLDGTLIEKLKDNPDLRESVTDMIGQLQSNGKLTIVPMVESAHVLSALWQAGANYIQGHYLQEPTTEMDYDFSTEDG